MAILAFFIGLIIGTVTSNPANIPSGYWEAIPIEMTDAGFTTKDGLIYCNDKTCRTATTAIRFKRIIRNER